MEISKEKISVNLDEAHLNAVSLQNLEISILSIILLDTYGSMCDNYSKDTSDSVSLGDIHIKIDCGMKQDNN